MTKSLLVSFVLLACVACQTASLAPAKPVSAGALSADYARSAAEVRSKYDGKEIMVRGYAVEPSIMPRPDADQGSVSLVERDSKSNSRVTCWFSKEQANEFSNIKADQYLTVRGVFNGESGVDLKFCKLMKVD
jgi:hypothetical protein